MESTTDGDFAPAHNPFYDPEELEGLYALAQYQPPADIDLQLFGVTDGSSIEMPFHETREYMISLENLLNDMNGVESLGEVQGGPVQYPPDSQLPEEDTTGFTSSDSLQQDMQHAQRHFTDIDATENDTTEHDAAETSVAKNIGTGSIEAGEIVESDGLETVSNSAQDNEVENGQPASSQQLQLHDDPSCNVIANPLPPVVWDLLPANSQEEIRSNPTLLEFGEPGSDEYNNELHRLALCALPGTAFDKHPITGKIQFAKRLECDYYEFSPVLNAELATREDIPYRDPGALLDATWRNVVTDIGNALGERVSTQLVANGGLASADPGSFLNATGNAFEDLNNAILSGVLVGATGMKEAIKNSICQELAANGNLGPLSLSASSEDAREQTVQRVKVILDDIAPVDLDHAMSISLYLQMNHYSGGPMQPGSTIAENGTLSEEDEQSDLASLQATHGGPGNANETGPLRAPQASMGSSSAPLNSFMPPQLNGATGPSASFPPPVPTGYFDQMNNATQVVGGGLQQHDSFPQMNQAPFGVGQPSPMDQPSQMVEHNYSMTFRQQPAAPVANQQSLVSPSQQNVGSWSSYVGSSFNQNAQQGGPFHPQANHPPMYRPQSASASRLHGQQQRIMSQQPVAPAMETLFPVDAHQQPSQPPNAVDDSKESWLLTGNTRTYNFTGSEMVFCECNDGEWRYLNDEQRARAYERAQNAAARQRLAVQNRQNMQANSIPMQHGMPIPGNNTPTTHANSTLMPSGMPCQTNNMSNFQTNQTYIQPGAATQSGNTYNTVAEALRRQPSQSPLNVRAPSEVSTNVNPNAALSTPVQKNTQTQPKKRVKANGQADGELSSKSRRKRKQLHGGTEDKDETSKDSA